MLGAPQNRALHRLSPNRPPTPLFYATTHEQRSHRVTHTRAGQMQLPLPRTNRNTNDTITGVPLTVLGEPGALVEDTTETQREGDLHH